MQPAGWGGRLKPEEQSESSAPSDPQEDPGAPLTVSAADGSGNAAGTQDLAYERIWVALLQRPWYSLAVVPSTSRVPARAAAHGIARAGSEYLGEPVRLFRTEGVRLGRGRRLLESLAGGALHGTVLSTDPPNQSEAALLLARNVDAVLLLVPLEQVRLAEVKELVERIGRDRIFGAVTVSA